MSKYSKNGSIPQIIKLPEKLYPQSTKLVAWNIVSYQSILKKVWTHFYAYTTLTNKKGFMRYIKAEKPDILILSETKARLSPIGIY